MTLRGLMAEMVSQKTLFDSSGQILLMHHRRWQKVQGISRLERLAIASAASLVLMSIILLIVALNLPL